MYILLAAFCDVSFFFFLKEALREQKSRREHQVTMYRKYRKGDLPDIQIKYSYIIAPLQAVAHVSIQRVIYNVSDIQINYSHRFYHLTINIIWGAAPHSVQHIYLILKLSICYHCINRIMVKIELCFTEGQLGSQTAFWCHIQGNILQDGWGQDGEGSTGDHTTNSEKHWSGTDHIHTILHSIHQLFAGNYHLLINEHFGDCQVPVFHSVHK